jgi:hypothetical protein
MENLEHHPKWKAVGKSLLEWSAWLQEPPGLETTIKVLRTVKSMGFEDGYRWLMAEERRCNIQACRTARLVARGAWRPSHLSDGSSDLAFWIAMRAEAAHDWMIQTFPTMARENPVADIRDGWSHQQACEWLLTEQWECRKGVFLKLELLEWLGPFPFYGDQMAQEWE